MAIRYRVDFSHVSVTADMFSLPQILRRMIPLLALLALATGIARAQPVISEFMASNTNGLADDDGAFSDWVEIHNPGATTLNLAGWYLTDTATNKTKWQFPEVTVPAGGYVVVYASNKNRRDPARALHTNFALSAGGEYLGLVQADGSTVVSEFAPAFPAQSENISYGLAQAAPNAGEMGFLRSPTPGAANTAVTDGSPAETVSFSRTSGPFQNAFSVTLTGAGGDQRIRYVAARPAGNSAPVSEPTAESPEYTGPILVDGSLVIRAAVFSADNAAHGPVSTVHFVKIGASAQGFTSTMPVLLLDHHGLGPQVKDGVDYPSFLYSYDARNDNSAVFAQTPSLATPLTASIRGQSSANFPKKGYNLKLTDEFGAKRSLPLLGGDAFEKWALVGPWNYDRTFVHNAFAYALSNRIGRWAPRTQLAEVFMNRDQELSSSGYAGIYVLTDRVEPAAGRVAIKPIAPNDTGENSITGGYLLKIDLKDDDEFGFTTSRGQPGNGYSSIVVAYPKLADLAPAQRDYIRNYVQQMEDAIYTDHARGFATRTYLDFIDRSSWVDFHLLNSLAGNLDALDRSAYFSKDRGGKIVAGPIWDFDRAFGSADVRNTNPQGWLDLDENTRGLWSRGWWEFVTRDPEFIQEWIDRWQQLRRGEFSNGNLTRLIDAQAALVDPLAAARDAARWPDNTSRYGDFAGEVNHMKTWLVARANWIDEQFVGAPRVTAGGDLVRLTPATGAQLVYTLDGSDPRMLGGAIAPNALVSDVAVDVPANANVHARSYRADRVNRFPDGPWSSAVGTANSSALTPASRLVNIASRGYVGNGETALIAGVVVTDSTSKPYIARAVGPALTVFGASGVVLDPQLSVFTNEGVEMQRNNGWQSATGASKFAEYFRSVGAFPLPADSQDSALASNLGLGAYTLQVTSPSGQGGVGLAELYELNQQGRTVNLSTRALVRTGDGVLIGGFVVQGGAHKRVLIRAVGPTLGAFGLGNTLADPVLTVYSGQEAIATNDRWGTADANGVITRASRMVGAFALANDSEDAALLITVPPGPYTVEVRGKNNSEGVALLEIYDLP